MKEGLSVLVASFGLVMLIFAAMDLRRAIKLNEDTARALAEMKRREEEADRMIAHAQAIYHEHIEP